MSLLEDATITVPHGASGLVVFAHGTGSSRLSPRNRLVARLLNRHGLATLLFDFLGNIEDVGDVRGMAVELMRLTDELGHDAGLRALPLGYYGAGTGAAAALWASAELGADRVGAVVARGGRPDLALDRLPRVLSPTLLIVGGNDEAIIEVNRRTLPLLPRAQLLLIPGATHLFEEPGTLDRVAAAAERWFVDHLVPTVVSRTG